MTSKSSSGECIGSLWVIGWLFSLGYLNLGFWKGIFALLLWPYFLGVGLAN